MLVCKKRYWHSSWTRLNIAAEALQEKWYQASRTITPMYIGEIVEVLVRD